MKMFDSVKNLSAQSSINPIFPQLSCRQQSCGGFEQ